MSSKLSEWISASYAPLQLLLCGALLAPASTEAQVVIRGVDDALQANVLALLGLDDEACDAPSWRVEQAYEDADKEIRSALEVFGYYSASIDASMRSGESCWLAEFDIDPGPQIMLRDVRIEIVGEAQSSDMFRSALTAAGLVPGSPLLQRAYEMLKQRLIALAQQRGYFDARFTESRVDVYPDENAADITLIFDSGRRYRFGEIVLDQDVLRDELVYRYLRIARGDYYDASALTSFQIELRDSGYFDVIDVTTMSPNPDTLEVPIAVHLTGAPRKQLSYGVGVSTDTGVRVRFGRNIRRWNDRGHQLSFRAMLSPSVKEVSANYRLPHGDPRTEWLSFDAGALREDTDTSQSESLQLGARRIIERRNDWTHTQLIRFQVEDFEVGGQTGRSQLLMPGAEWSKVVSNNDLWPTRGHKLDFELRAAADRLASDTSFAQFTARGKWVRGLGAASRVLIRSEFGLTRTEHFEHLPPSIRFFAGGDNSVRGYDFETLGPLNDAGLVIGGPRLFTASVEFERRVRERWSVAVFADTGNAFEGSHLDLQSGTGIGARWQSPLGPIRIDLAKPLDGTDHGLRLHINLGPDL